MTLEERTASVRAASLRSLSYGPQDYNPALIAARERRREQRRNAPIIGLGFRMLDRRLGIDRRETP